MKWKILFKSLFYSLVIVAFFLTMIQYVLSSLFGYNTSSIEIMADLFPPLILLVGTVFIGLTTILYQLMRM